MRDIELFQSLLNFFEATSWEEVGNMVCVVLEGKSRSHGKKSKRVNACGPALHNEEQCVAVRVCVCTHVHTQVHTHTCTCSDFNNNIPAMLEKELNMRRITQMYFKVFSPEGPAQSFTHYGYSLGTGHLIKSFCSLSPFIWKALPYLLQIFP